MNELILVRYGDLVLKGKNKKYFTQLINKLIKEKLSGLPVEYDFRHDRCYVILNDASHQEVIEKLQYVTGLYSYSLVSKCEIDYDEISRIAVLMIREATNNKLTTFKVETKRADKSIELTSMEISKLVSKKILVQMENLKVDVHNPELTLDVEVRTDGAYIYLNQIMGTGGFPVSIGGKVIVLLSGGIDSPVAAFLAMKKGLQIECVHFESTPMTSIESVQKVIDLTEVLARYAPSNKIKLHLVPFFQLHEAIIQHIPESYLITIMRRMMLRIASEIKTKAKALAIVTGDSIGQVASQTLESMATIQQVTDDLIIRPLASYDKLEIMTLARKIKTLDISNRPFSDCCSVYVPKSPSIRPEVFFAEKYEFKFAFKNLIEEIVSQTKTLEIDAFVHRDLQSLGLTVAEALK